jgi:hypothetical protein
MKDLRANTTERSDFLSNQNKQARESVFGVLAFWLGGERDVITRDTAVLPAVFSVFGILYFVECLTETIFPICSTPSTTVK